MTRTTQETASFLAAHAAPLPAHVTRDAVQGTLARMNRDAARASAIAPNATFATLTLDDPEGRALCTIHRPRVYDREGLYNLYLCDGRLVAAFARVPTIRGAFDAVIGYLAQALPADCDPAAEVESYRASFRDNWEGDLAASAYPTFKASALTRAARWAFRLAAAEAEVKAQPEPFRAPCKGEVGYTEPAPLRIKLEAPAPVAEAPAPVGLLGPDQFRDVKAPEGWGKAPTEVVDVTPTWAGVARIIELGLTHGNATGRQIAREELTRMAAIADSAVAAAKDTARSEALEMARACLAAYPQIARGKGRESEPARRARDLRDALAALVGAMEGKAPDATPDATPDAKGGDAWDAAAESVASELARSAVRNCLGSGFTSPESASRDYHTDSGLLTCRASFDGDSVRVAWDCDGVPTSRAGAELLIRNRMARMTQGR